MTRAVEGGDARPARAVGRPEAAERVAELVGKIAGGRTSQIEQR